MEFVHWANTYPEIALGEDPEAAAAQRALEVGSVVRVVSGPHNGSEGTVPWPPRSNGRTCARGCHNTGTGMLMASGG